jgi:hypothetical protein
MKPETRLKSGAKRANGGKRPGAGAKPGAYTLLKRRVIAECVDEAEKSFAFYVKVRDNDDETTDIRLAAADRILDRVLGKPSSRLEIDDGKFSKYHSALDAFIRVSVRSLPRDDSAATDAPQIPDSAASLPDATGARIATPAHREIADTSGDALPLGHRETTSDAAEFEAHDSTT